MRTLIVCLSLLVITIVIHRSFVLLDNRTPSLRVVEKKIDVSNVEARQLGYPIIKGREYFRKIVYEEQTQTKGLRLVITRDTTSNSVHYRD